MFEIDGCSFTPYNFLRETDVSNNIFSITLYLIENFGKRVTKSVKFYAYLAGIIESVKNVVENNKKYNKNYDVVLFVNRKLIEYGEMSKINIYDEIDYDNDSFEDSIKKMLLFMKMNSIVKILIYNCVDYVNISTFGMLTKFFPLFLEHFDEVHIRDTDSCFGHDIDYYWIDQWEKNTNNQFYVFATFNPQNREYTKKWMAKTNQSNANFKTIVGTGWGGRSVKNRNLAKEKIIDTCKNIILDKDPCPYGSDEIILAQYMMPFMKNNIYRLGTRIGTTYENTNDIYTDICYKVFCMVLGVESKIIYINNPFMVEKYNDFLSSAETNNLYTLYKVMINLFIATKKIYGEKIDEVKYFKLCEIIIPYIKKYNPYINLKKIYSCFEYIYVSLNKYIFVNTKNNFLNFQKDVENIIRTQNYAAVNEYIFTFLAKFFYMEFPNSVKYTQLELTEFDKNIQKYSQFENNYLFSFDDNHKYIFNCEEPLSFRKYYGNVNNVKALCKFVYNRILVYDTNNILQEFVEEISKVNMRNIDDYVEFYNIVNDNKLNIQPLIFITKTNLYGTKTFDCVDNDNFAVIYEYVDGITLNEFCKTYGDHINNEFVEKLYNFLVQTINVLHSNNYVYLDIHDKNILVGSSFYLIDPELVVNLNKPQYYTTKIGLISYSLPNSETIGNYVTKVPEFGNYQTSMGNYVTDLNAYKNSLNQNYIKYDNYCIFYVIDTIVKKYSLSFTEHYKNKNI